MSSIRTRKGPGHRHGTRDQHGSATGRAPHANTIAGRHWPWLALLLALASLAAQAQPMAQPAPQAPAGSPATILFESTAVPATEPGGGLSVTSTSFPGHTFRLTERAHVTALGSRLIGLTGRSVFAALYQLDTTHTPPDVTADSTLLATTLLTPASTAIADVSGAVDLILEPGWYAIVLGLDRHGATATNHQVSLATTGMPVTPMSRGTYSVNPATGATTTHQSRFRLFVSGHWLPPAAVPPQAFMIESARPWAWTSGGTSINASQTYAMHFRLDGNTRIEQIDTWLMNASGTLYGAIFPLAGSGARPPLPNSAGFADQAVASTLIAGQPGFHRASARFDGALLPRGDYALVLGSGHFGANGSATILRAEDQVTGVSMLLYPGSGPVWFNHEPNAMMRLSGTEPDLIGDHELMQFGPTLIGEQHSRLLTLHNQNPDPEQYLDLTISLAGTDSGQFALIDAAACEVMSPSATCQMTVTYQPDHVAAGDGDHHATLVLEHNGQPELLIGLTGTALASAWVTPVPAAHGNIIPDTAQRVALGTTFEFQLQPAANHHVASVGGSCTGGLEGNVFTTAPVQADCTVAPVFAIDTFQINASASGHGSISPAGTITVEFGDTPSFTITPDTGHHLDEVTGSCTGTLAGDVYTLEPVSADCALHAGFVLAPATLLTILSGSGQSTPVNTAFAEPLVLRVSNDAGLPVPGVQVHFQVPANGAGLLPPAHASSNDQGEVIVTVIANNALGSYPVQAGTAGLEPVVFQLTNLAPASNLALDIDNGLPHLAYGSPAAYLVSLRNTGQDPALKAQVLVPLPAQLDPEQAEWFCLDPDSGCQASGTGALDEDGLVLAAGSQVQYLLSAPVRLDATGEEVVIEAYAEAEHHPPVSASSHSWLVLFRDGFQLPPGSEPVSGQPPQQ